MPNPFNPVNPVKDDSVASGHSQSTQDTRIFAVARARLYSARSDIAFGRAGDRWFDRRLSAVLAVQSTVIPFEHNYRLNPRHRDFPAIAIEPPVPFIFDERLFGAR